MTGIISDKEYASWLTELKQRVREAQTRAAVKANSELVLLYWRIGKDILDRQDRQGWGAKVIDQLSIDLRKEFPEMRGLSPSNLGSMLAFARAWTGEANLQQLVGKLPCGC